MFKVAERLMKERKNQGFSIKAMAEKGGGYREYPAILWIWELRAWNFIF